MRWISPIAARVADTVIDRMLRNHDERIRQIIDTPLINGKLLVDIRATTGGTEVLHGLGKVPNGAFVIRSTTVSSFAIYDFSKTSFYILSSTADRTVNVWVF